MNSYLNAIFFIDFVTRLYEIGFRSRRQVQATPFFRQNLSNGAANTLGRTSNKHSFP